MPRGGQNKKSAAEKRLAGNPGRRPLGGDGPRPLPVAPRCPRGLPEGAKAKWRQLAPKLRRLGLLTEVDGEAFAALCLHWSLMLDAAADVEEHGLLIDGPRGAKVKNPSLQVLRDNSAAFAKYAVAFGLDPTSRNRVVVTRTDEDDESFWDYKKSDA